MAKKEASVAPKERINLTYKPAIDGAQEEVELPLKVLFTGDFTGRADDRPIEEREVLAVDKDINDIDKVMASQNIALDIQVKNVLSQDPNDKLAVHLDVRDMDSFSPDRVAEDVPVLKQMLELRDALAKLRGPLGNLAEFRKKLNELVRDEAAVGEIVKKLDGRNLPVPKRAK